jgi:lipopolysaccharide export system protein LptA
MASAVSRLRRWIALAAFLVLAVVAGFYAYGRWRIHSVVQGLPAKLTKLGLDVKQTADSFSVSKSEQGRTIFTARASRAVQLKDGGRVELHNVVITVYGRDADRYDQISGADFEFDPHSGDISARGPVTIDLVANPKGLLHPDQAPPEDLKEPLHIRTSGLVFNQKTGNGFTHEKVEFSMATASGWADGGSYDSHSGELTLERSIRINTMAPNAAELTATRGLITKSPPQVFLAHVHLTHGPQQVEAENATVFLTEANTIERVLGKGNVQVTATGPTELALHSEQAEIFLAGQKSQLHQAVVSGNVHIVTSGRQNTEAFADRTILDFVEGTVLSKARAEGNVKLIQTGSSQAGQAGRTEEEGQARSSTAQQVQITASAMDFLAKNGRLSEAQTSGAAEITISPASASPGPAVTGQAVTGQVTHVTAGQFTAKLDGSNRLHSLHGAPNAVITSVTPGQPDRVSASAFLDVAFRPQGGINSIVQQGDVRYHDGQRMAFAEQGVFTPGNHLIVLSGAPRVTGQGLTTTADTFRLNRESGEATAEGNVKSTYSELKPQPNGALLASSDPIHVTAKSMQARRDSGVALYSGNARLWQGPNVVQASTIRFDRDGRSMVAEGITGGESPAGPVTTVLVQTGADGKTTLVTITSLHLTYTDSERRIHFDGGVTMRNTDAMITGESLDVYLAQSRQATSNQVLTHESTTPSRLEKAIAHGGIVITQLTRRATGETLTYLAAEDKFTLEGGPPSIFDAERGQITGDSLTFFRHDDRVLVEGKANSPVITKTRVAH